MATVKYAKIGGAWKLVVAEHAKVGGAWKLVTSNYVKIGEIWKTVPIGEKSIFVCEQFSDRLYAIDDQPAVITGWPEYGSGIVDPRSVAYDGNNGYSYWACANKVYCMSDAGAIQWIYSGHATTVTAICVDYNGMVYTGDLAGVTKKIVSFPGIGPGYSVAWSQTIGTNYAVYALAVDASTGMLYAGTGYAKDAVYGCTANIGNWTIRYASTKGDVTGIGIDEDIPSLYVGTGDGYLMKMGTNGYVYWGGSAPIPSAQIYAVCIGHDGHGYCATGTRKSIKQFIIATGAGGWEATIGGTADAVGCTVDEYGNVYGTFRKAGTSTDNVVRKVNSSGTEAWNWQPYVSAQFYGVAVSPGIKAAGF